MVLDVCVCVCVSVCVCVRMCVRVILSLLTQQRDGIVLTFGRIQVQPIDNWLKLHQMYRAIFTTQRLACTSSCIMCCSPYH